MLDNIGLPQRTYNLAFTDGTTIGVNDGTIQIQLKDRPRAHRRQYIRKLRDDELPAAFPDVQFYFQPADLVTQILNFGVPTPDRRAGAGQGPYRQPEAIAKDISKRIAALPGIVDAHVQQELDAPEMYYTIDRTRAQELGLNVNQVANDINISLSSSEQVSPNFWTDPKNGIPYYMAVQTPEYRLHDKNDLDNIPIASTASDQHRRRQQIPDLLRQCGDVRKRQVQSVYTTRPTSSRCMTSMPACRAATWAVRRPRSTRIVADERGHLAYPTRSTSGARSPA